MASGILSGKYTEQGVEDTRLGMKGMEWLKDRTLAADRMEKANALQQLANNFCVSLAKLSIAWCLKNPNVSTVILGASKVPQLQENLQVLEVLPVLTEDVLSEIERVVKTKPKLADF